MSPTEPRRRRALNLHCSVCDRSYSKKEHLQRHERSHTGAKPFTCHVCGRTFSRQDVLNRHTRVHERSGSLVTPVAQADASMLLDQNLNAPYQITPVDTVISPLTANNGFRQPEIPGVPLFWPDSEDLLQNIMSIDPALWEQPMTLMPSALASNASPDIIFDYANFNTDGDEGHRAIQTLSAQLSNTFTGVTAPAALAGLTSRFLDSCLHMFFSTFIPMLPVIHRPTFVFRDCSPPLLLNAIAIGSLFLGTKEATVKGDALWRLAHTAVATSWHSMINHRGEYDAAPGLQLVQTSLLSQVYAALAKSRTLRMTSQVFHGLGIYWARHCGLYDLMQVPALPSINDSIEVKHQAWRVWLARESRLRSLLGLYILDGVISQYSGSPTFAQHMSNQLPMSSDELSFSASNPEDWLQRMMQRSSTSHSLRFCDIFRAFFYPKKDGATIIPPGLTFLSLKVVLEGLKSLVAESKRIEPPPVGVPSQADINLVLDRIRQYIHNSPSLSVVEKRVAMLRWHAICLDALLVTARGARRLCFGHGIVQHIFGGGERFEVDINAERHVEKDEARRTLLHAREIQHIASQLPLGHAHDAHVPGAVFAAATTFAAFALAGRTRIQFPSTVDWCVAVLLPPPEAGDLDPIWDSNNLTGASATTAAFIRRTIDAPDLPDNAPIIDLSYELSSVRLLLRGLSLQWGVCSEMEEVVDAWISKCT